MRLPLFVAACLLASSTAFAQAPQGDTQKTPPRKGRFDCSQAKDPKACEERMAKMKAAHSKAEKACASAKEGDERHACMRKEMCAQAKDPAACEARAKERAARHAEFRAKVREACKGKEGEALKACAREQRGNKK